MKLFPFTYILLVFLFFAGTAKGNGDPVSTIDSISAEQVNWHLLDPEKDNIQGASIIRTWELLNNRKPQKTILVAVIDSGIDIFHEDLKGKIWLNTDEIPNNGIDDDNNGYIDDLHGWNFIGNTNGENVEHENLEYVRIIRKFKERFANITSESDVPPKERNDYRLYVQSLNKYESELGKYQAEKNNLDQFEMMITECEEIVKKALGKEGYTIDDLKALETTELSVAEARDFLINIHDRGFLRDELNEIKEYYEVRLEKHLNLSFNPRSIINDDPEDITDKDYGNNDVKGPGPDHGTFVAGIISAISDNKIGISGIAKNAIIMPLRVVPDGDEYDKDVALAIRYAVDNGAQIINMSFGKEFSPQKYMVDDAMKYAVENNVLIIHAAGNNAINIDKTIHYPTARLNDRTVAASVITVGAISKNLGQYLVGNFTNYGKEEVDIFAPGVDMVSLYPDNKYDIGSGTSFSSPVVAGVAALIWSYYPHLTAIQLKELLLRSAYRYPKLKVYLPNDSSWKQKRIKFGKLSKTGGIVNAYEAVKLAEKKYL